MLLGIRHLCAATAAAIVIWMTAPGALKAADLPNARAFDAQAPAQSEGWAIRFTPYVWATSLNGTQTVRGRSVKVDETFVDILHDTLGKGGQLLGFMGHVEAQNGPVTLFGDVVLERIGIKRGGVTERSLAPGIAGRFGASGDLRIKMAIAEAGVAYEVARFGLPFGDGGVPVALEILAGGRYWYQQVDLSLDTGRTIDIADLVTLQHNRALAKSGSVDWVDPFVGGRVKLAVAPGHELFVRGDVGGFGAGSKFSWQAVAGYNFDFAVCDGVTYSGLLGYKLLYVDYAQGSGRRRYEFAMLQHGPMMGLSMRW